MGHKPPPPAGPGSRVRLCVASVLHDVSRREAPRPSELLPLNNMHGHVRGY